MIRKKLAVGIMATIMAAGLSMTSFAGTWKQDNVGWWYQNSDMSYPKSAWMQDTDGKWYYFDANGYMVANKWAWIDGNNDGMAECYGFSPSGVAYMNATTPDGYTVDSNGAWIVNGILQQQAVAAGNGTTGSTGTSTSGATNIYADFKTDFDANWKVIYTGTDGQILKNQWLLFGLYGDQARWVYLDSNGYEIVNGTSPDGYPLDGAGFYYATATETDKAVIAARNAARDKSTNSGSTSTSTNTTNSTTTNTSQVVAGSWADIGEEEFNRQLFELINEYRNSNGLANWEASDEVAEMATIRAAECAEKFSHVRPDGTGPEQLCKELGINRFVYVGCSENCLKSTINETPQGAFEAWKNSSGHNKVMLQSHSGRHSNIPRYMAIGSYSDGNDLYVSMDVVAIKD